MWFLQYRRTFSKVGFFICPSSSNLVLLSSNGNNFCLSDLMNHFNVSKVLSIFCISSTLNDSKTIQFYFPPSRIGTFSLKKKTKPFLYGWHNPIEFHSLESNKKQEMLKDSIFFLDTLKFQMNESDQKVAVLK